MATTLEADTDTGGRGPFPWRSLLACVATAFLGFAIGLAVRRDAPPAPTSLDVRFLQDMRFHHEQAVGMSLMLLDKPEATGDRTVRSIAREIVQSQAFEGGRMGEMLMQFGVPVANEGDTAMEWMGMRVPLGEMPGMASPDDTAALQRATGAEADRLFVRLMITHHDGGVHMAEAAMRGARRTEVRALATAIVTSQRAEIRELRALADRL
jgi:uncharacterized protein (DUF305 family)